jgi:predicted dehydrogenase
LGNELSVAIAGVGRWGNNLLRNFATASRCRVSTICDLDEATLRRQAASHPRAKATTRFDEVVNDRGIDAVVIATKAVTHHALAKQALEAGKHVYVEKPLAMSATEAADLAATADRVGRKLMVGHLMIYHPCLTMIREMIDRRELGQVYYIYCHRVNLGVVRQDENAWWSLAPHDVSMICHLFNAEPVTVAASGQCYLQRGIEDVAFAVLNFADGRTAHVHVSWLDPHKIRKVTIVGSKRMVTFDDMEAAEKIRIYDKGAEVEQSFESYAQAISIRTGDIRIPKVDLREPLKLEVQHFVDAVLDDRPIRTDGAEGVRVVRVLQAGGESLRRGGEPVKTAEVR